MGFLNAHPARCRICSALSVHVLGLVTVAVTLLVHSLGALSGRQLLQPEALAPLKRLGRSVGGTKPQRMEHRHWDQGDEKRSLLTAAMRPEKPASQAGPRNFLRRRPAPFLGRKRARVGNLYQSGGGGHLQEGAVGVESAADRMLQPGLKPSAHVLDCSQAATDLTSMTESGNFFCDDDEAWELRKEISQAQQQFQRRTSPARPGAFHQENWEPNFSCAHEQRLGPHGIGGKWVCDPHRLPKLHHRPLVYYFRSSRVPKTSVSTREGYLLEEELAAALGERCQIFRFEPDVSDAPEEVPESLRHVLTFKPWALGPPGSSQSSRQMNGVEAYSLQEIVSNLGHSNTTITSLIMDTQDGAEYYGLLPLLENGIFEQLNVHQVQILVNPSNPGRIHRLLGGLHSSGYAIFHKEARIRTASMMSVEYSFLKLSKSFWNTNP